MSENLCWCAKLWACGHPDVRCPACVARAVQAANATTTRWVERSNRAMEQQEAREQAWQDALTAQRKQLRALVHTWRMNGRWLTPEECARSLEQVLDKGEI